MELILSQWGKFDGVRWIGQTLAPFVKPGERDHWHHKRT